MTAGAERLRFPFPTKMLWESQNVSYLNLRGCRDIPRGYPRVFVTEPSHKKG